MFAFRTILRNYRISSLQSVKTVELRLISCSNSLIKSISPDASPVKIATKKKRRISSSSEEEAPPKVEIKKSPVVKAK